MCLQVLLVKRRVPVSVQSFAHACDERSGQCIAQTTGFAFSLQLPQPTMKGVRVRACLVVGVVHVTLNYGGSKCGQGAKVILHFLQSERKQTRVHTHSHSHSHTHTQAHIYTQRNGNQIHPRQVCSLTLRELPSNGLMCRTINFTRVKMHPEAPRKLFFKKGSWHRGLPLRVPKNHHHVLSAWDHHCHSANVRPSQRP